MGVKPHEVAVAVGVALDEADFCLQMGDARSHAHRYVRETYEASFGPWSQWASDVLDILGDLGHMGVHVSRLRAVDDISKLTRSHPVVVLGSHWSGSLLQIQNDFVPVSAVASAVGEDYRGGLGLGICHAVDDVGPELQRRCPRVRLMAIRGESFLTRYLRIVRATLRVLQSGPEPFVDTFSQVAAEIILQVHARYPEER